MQVLWISKKLKYIDSYYRPCYGNLPLTVTTWKIRQNMLDNGIQTVESRQLRTAAVKKRETNKMSPCYSSAFFLKAISISEHSEGKLRDLRPP